MKDKVKKVAKKVEMQKFYIRGEIIEAKNIDEAVKKYSESNK